MTLLALAPFVVDPDVTPDDGGSATFLGFVFTFALAAALVLLALSLTRQLRKVDRGAPPDELPGSPDAESGDAATPVPSVAEPGDDEGTSGAEGLPPEER